jgi:hypothetical protein
MFGILARAEVLLAEGGWTWKNIISSLASQEGVIRLAIVCLAVGLFIMLKK